MQHCVHFNKTSPLPSAGNGTLHNPPTHISIASGMPNTNTNATTTFSLSSGVERRAYVHMGLIIADVRPNGLYDSQFRLVHVDIVHRATETFDYRIDGCWRQGTPVSWQ
jgi:hypothetical protein